VAKNLIFSDRLGGGIYDRLEPAPGQCPPGTDQSGNGVRGASTDQPARYPSGPANAGRPPDRRDRKSGITDHLQSTHGTRRPRATARMRRASRAACSGSLRRPVSTCTPAASGGFALAGGGLDGLAHGGRSSHQSASTPRPTARACGCRTCARNGCATWTPSSWDHHLAARGTPEHTGRPLGRPVARAAARHARLSCRSSPPPGAAGSGPGRAAVPRRCPVGRDRLRDGATGAARAIRARHRARPTGVSAWRTGSATSPDPAPGRSSPAAGTSRPVPAPRC
jgi:hypothetical protein